MSTRKRDVKDGKAEDMTRQPEQVRAFRDTWRLGIHSYLAYLRDRLVVARELLTEGGSCFVQIGDENVHLVRCVMDEVFGSDNFVCTVVTKKTSGATSDFVPSTCDYVVWFAKARASAKFRQLYLDKVVGGVGASGYTRVRLPNGDQRPLTAKERDDASRVPDGARIYAADNLTSQSVGRAKGEGAASWFAVAIDGKEYRPSEKVRWKTNEEGMSRLLIASRVLVTGGEKLAYLRYLDDFPALPLSDVWTDTVGQNQMGGDKLYVVQTANRIIERCILMTTDPGDLVLDPTCGSGTTAYVAEQWGRRWITIDTSRVAMALTRTRLMAAKLPYYLLADSQEGLAKEANLLGTAVPRVQTRNDIKKGFVYKRVPHVTLKSIANNPDIVEGMTREQVDQAIARHADIEVLYDQPYQDKKRVRVAGPFTVESLSPHRILDTDTERPDSEAIDDAGAGGFVHTILDNLRPAGVQNTRKKERLQFDRLEPFAGEWLHGEGEFTDADGHLRRVAISIGPEHGTVGADQVKEAAKEALKGAGYDLLLVCGFAFDPLAGEASDEFRPTSRDGFAATVQERQMGKLPVQLVRMNPDLAMGEELLKKTGAGNLFMVFGEPDLLVHSVAGGEIEVEVRGVDVYDPTTGQIRSSSTDDIACWFIDTDYNGESFFVRHAYFLGANDPYKSLKTTLRSEINEDAWQTLHNDTSRPFEKPEGGRIAVKVINHLGDEVMKVFRVE